MDTIGERIKKIRQLKGVTQLVISDKAGINAALYRQYECGDRTPKVAQLQKIADALEIDITFLQPTRYDTPSAIFASLFDMIDAYGDVTFHVDGEVAFIGVKITDNPAALNELDVASKAHLDLNIDDFKKWLITHKPD